MNAPTKEELHEEAMGTVSTEKRPLWAVAAEEWDGKEWGLIVRYNHAENQAHARANYIMARGAALFRIVSVGVVIGYKVNDNQGLALSV